MKSRKHCSICGEAGHTKTTCLAEFLPRATAVDGVAVTPPTAPERCPTCDKPKGDQARADAHPLAKQWSAWIAMVPGQQRPLRWRDVADAQAADQPGMCIESQCQPVDWRARAIAAEAAAARWAKVAPLIERLCGAVGAAHLVSRAEAERRIMEATSALLAAAKATP